LVGLECRRNELANFSGLLGRLIVKGYSRVRGHLQLDERAAFRRHGTVRIAILRIAILRTSIVAAAGAAGAIASMAGRAVVASVASAMATTAVAVTAVGVIASATATKKSSAAATTIPAIIGIAVGVALVCKAVVVHWVAVAIARTTGPTPATIAVPAAATIPAPVRPVVAAVVGCVITSGITSGPKFAFHAGGRIKAFAFPTFRGV